MLVLVADLIPLIFGIYIWETGDGIKDKNIGETTIIESLSVLLPYGSSLILLYTTADFFKVNLGMKFAGWFKKKEKVKV